MIYKTKLLYIFLLASTFTQSFAIHFHRTGMFAAMKGSAFLANKFYQEHSYINFIAKNLLIAPELIVDGVCRVASYKIDNEFTKKLIKSSSHGFLYSLYYNNVLLNLKNDSNYYFSSVALRQACYVPVDMLVTESLDKIADIEVIKKYIDILPVKKQESLKKHLSVITSSLILDLVEQSLIRKDGSSAYDKSFGILALNHIANAAVDEGIKACIPSESIIEQMVFSFGMHYYISHIMQVAKSVLGYKNF